MTKSTFLIAAHLKERIEFCEAVIKKVSLMVEAGKKNCIGLVVIWTNLRNKFLNAYKWTQKNFFLIWNRGINFLTDSVETIFELSRASKIYKALKNRNTKQITFKGLFNKTKEILFSISKKSLALFIPRFRESPEQKLFSLEA